MRWVTNEASRAADAATIAAGTPGLVLMKRAAAAVAREVARAIAVRPERASRVVVLAGPGNNGGDGFETARLVMAARVASRVETLLLGAPDHLAKDARTTYQRLEQTGGAVRSVENEADLESLRTATLVVDALFGTGLKRPITRGGLADRAVTLAARAPFAVAVDLPSGLSGDASDVWEPSARADVTITFGAPKRCHVHAPAAGRCGRIVVADIGLLAAQAEENDLEVIAAADAAGVLPGRNPEAHKGVFGHVAIAGGSWGMAGAPALTARAALRGGAGLATVLAPEAVRPLVHGLVPEATTEALDADAASYDALAVGPGLGRSDQAQRAFDRLVGVERPAVFDADALNLAGTPETFAARTAGTVLTPHPGEAARLLGMDVPRVQSDRLAAAREIARRGNAVVVLKGFRSVVADASGRAAFVLAGNAGMATGGTGDVLTGLVGAFLARGLSPWDAATAAAWLHGTAGDLGAERLGQDALMAGDVVESIPAAWALLYEAR